MRYTFSLLLLIGSYTIGIASSSTAIGSTNKGDEPPVNPPISRPKAPTKNGIKYQYNDGYLTIKLLRTVGTAQIIISNYSGIIYTSEFDTAFEFMYYIENSADPVFIEIITNNDIIYDIII